MEEEINVMCDDHDEDDVRMGWGKNRKRMMRMKKELLGRQGTMMSQEEEDERSESEFLSSSSWFLHML